MPLNNPQESAIAIQMKGTAGGPQNNNIRIASGIYTPTQAMNNVIDISSFGFTAITDVIVTAERNTNDPMQVPNVAISSYNMNQLFVNITQGSTAVVTILNINVLSGPPIVAATNLNTIKLHVRIEGY